MGILSILLLVIFALSAVLLVILVLVQDEQGEGLGGIFGGGGSGQIGNRKGNILTRATSILGFVFILSSLGLAWLNRTPDLGNVEAAARQQNAEQSVEWWNESQEAENSQGSAE
ncbi:preprotein translocase subunit SecG [Spirochaeta lutea]|uniref:Protein-export membrane protein SecG n=2 Tax=Spirochaeta lutea TaxID=1480694 RepID=A0A098R4P2_9SPIO|nr:preprotein translocase subunit SecG [Spirochaeta lutea]